jgi:hypothetical protein
MLDSWRTERLTVPSVTRSVYNLTANTQTYTIGSGGTFNQDYPESIALWSVIPDDDATHPLELPMGEPYTYDQWQQLRIKSQTGPHPTRMYFDHAFAAGLGNLLFHPIPDNNDVDIVLYQRIPALTALVAGTQYNLRPGYALAIKLNLAIAIAERNSATVSDKLEKRAATAYGSIKRANIRHLQTPIRAEFVIGSGRGRRTFNIRTGGH